MPSLNPGMIRVHKMASLQSAGPSMFIMESHISYRLAAISKTTVKRKYNIYLVSKQNTPCFTSGAI
jgi:hypothetical protein